MLRTLSFLLLAFVLALTSQSMAVARGASAATGQMVICTGTGPIAVYVDAEGQPTSAPHLCPDAALHVLVDVTLPSLAQPLVLARFDAVVPRATGLAFHALIKMPPARGPPVLI